MAKIHTIEWTPTEFAALIEASFPGRTVQTTAPIRASTLPSIMAPFPAFQLVLNIRAFPGW